MKNPPGKQMFGTVKVGDKGQIVIPKDARDMFGIRPGDSLLLLGDIDQGLAIVKPELTEQVITRIMRGGQAKEEAACTPSTPKD